MSDQNQSALSVINAQGKLTAVNTPPTCVAYFAEKLGITAPKSTKDNPFTMKELLLTTEGAALSKDTVKQYRKEHKALVAKHYTLSAVFAGALAADPRFRKNVRSSFDKNKECNGWNISVRRERSASASGAARIAQLEAQIAKLTLALTAGPAVG